jgi:exoribonuclease-2
MPVLARAQRLPLVLNIVGGPSTLARGQQVRLRLGPIDDISLDVQGHFAALIGDDPGQEPASEADDDEAAGPIAIAVDLSDADGEAPAPSST